MWWKDEISAPSLTLLVELILRVPCAQQSASWHLRLRCTCEGACFPSHNDTGVSVRLQGAEPLPDAASSWATLQIPFPFLSEARKYKKEMGQSWIYVGHAFKNVLCWFKSLFGINDFKFENQRSGGVSLTGLTQILFGFIPNTKQNPPALLLRDAIVKMFSL